MQFFVNGSPVCGDTVPLGVQGENLATQITADVSGWLAQWPDGQVIVRLIDANRQSHLADTVVNDGTLVWIVTAADTAQGGYGVGVIELVQGDVVKKSEPFATRVITDPQASGQAPEPVPGWVEETIARMEELEAGAAQSAGAAQTSAQSAQTGAQSAQTAAAQAAQSAEDATAVLGQVETAGAAQVAAVQAAGQQQTQAVTAAGAQQVSAVQTEGADQRAAVETAGAAQVNAIQAEGQTQQTAIQQKGADTLASIPADYTELAGDVADLKSEISNIGVPPQLMQDDAQADLDITDPDGNVIARYVSGEFQTQKFRSWNAPVSKTSTGDGEFEISDEAGNVILRIKNGDIITSAFSTVGTHEHVVTVKQDGSGDFTSLRAAVDSITDASVDNPYRIEIYPGTYYIMNDYTEAEIRQADTESYHVFPGLMISDGMALVGVGCRDDIIIYGTLDDTVYNARIRGNISTLNIKENARLENLTIVCNKLRYCVHDDETIASQQAPYSRIVRNCRFDMQRAVNASDDDSGVMPNSYGAGYHAKGVSTLFENCDFGTALGIHTAPDLVMSTHHVIRNCRGYAFRPNDRNEDVRSEFIVNDCNFDIIRYGHYTDSAKQIFTINGTGNLHTMVNCSPTDEINIGNMTRHKNTMNLPVLTMVKRSGQTYEKTTDGVIACGIIVLIKGEYVYIQKCGYINSAVLGMTGLAMGDYITIDSDGILTRSGATASNAVGVITNIDEYNVAYMKMLIGE